MRKLAGVVWTHGISLVGEVVAADGNSVACNSDAGNAGSSSSAGWGATEGTSRRAGVLLPSQFGFGGKVPKG